MATSEIGIKIGLTGAEAVQSQLAKVEQAMGGVDAQTVRVADAFQQLGNSTAGIGTVGQAMAQYTQQTRDARVEANLLRQANRQLAVQMTDVVTSLASGMPAWMVFIQQGGQIKDSYGGIGRAIQGVTGYLRTLINPLTVAGTAFAAVGAAAFMGAREMDAYVKALTLSGNAAGTTAGALDQMAERIGKVAGTQGRAAEVLAGLAANGNIAASALESVTLAAIELERAGGPAAEETAKRFAALGDKPLTAALKLNEQTRFLTLSVYEQIKALESQGRTAEATAVATNAALAKTQESTKTLEGRLGILEKSWRFVGDAAKGAWDAMLGIGRQDSLEQQLENVRSELGRRMSAQGSARSDNRSAYQPAIDALRLQEAFLQEQLRLQARSITLEGERAAVVQARAEWDKKGSQYLSDQQKMQKEITEAQRLGLEGKIAQAEVERRIAAIRASYAGKGGSEGMSAEAKATAEAIKQRERYLETLSAGTDKIAKETQALADQVAQVVLGKQAFQDIIDAREEEQAVILETQAIRALDRNLDAKEFDSLKAQAQAIRDRINARKALATATVEATDREIMARRSAFKDQDAQEIIDTERLKNSQSIIDAINRETEALQMSKVEREVAIALLAAEARGIKAGSYEYEEYAKNIRAAIVNRETVRASIEQTKTIEQEWRRTADQIGQSLTDALMQGGKSAWEYIKGLFRSMVLRPIIQAVVNPIVGSFGGGGGGALSTLGSINSLASLGSAITGSVTGSIANVIGTAGTMFGSSALTAFSAGMKGATLAPGLMGPTTAGAGGAMGAGASVAAAVPYVAAALAVANALGVFRSRSIVGGGLTGTLGMGDIQSYDLQRRGGTLFSGPEYSMVNRQTSTESAAIQSAFEALRTNAASMAEALGLSSTAVKSFTTTLGTDITQNDIGTRGIKLDGLTPEQAAKKVEEALAAANEDLAAFVLGASRTVTETLTTRIEDWEQTESGSTFRGFIDQVSEVTRTIEATGTSYARAGETNVQTLTRLAGSLSTINPALELLGLNLYATSLAGADLASQLADAFGGLENFTQASAAYYAEFFTEAERTAKTTAQLTEALGGLGLALPTTRDAYRQLVEAQDLTTEAGRKNFAVLVQLSGTFAGITPVVEDLADASDQATEALRSAADILRERQGLERQLLQLQDDTAALRALDRAELDESNRALFDRITALQDSQAAEAAAAEATRTAAAEAEEAARAAAAETQRIGQERLGLERQLLQLQGDTAALRALDRAALDESNRALFDQIQALQNTQAAAQAAAESERALAAERQRIAQERAGLERQLLQLQGDTSALRALDRAALDASNRALYDQITALQDSKTAAEAAAQAEATLASERERVAQERSGLSRQLLQLQGNTTALRALDRAALDESNRALYDQIQALQDSQAATTAAAESERALAAERERIAQERAGLERQLLQLQGDTVAIRALERAALAASNRALYDKIQALQDSQAAAAAAAESERALAAERERIAQERAGLERQLLQLQGDTVAIRALERAGLAASNRALYDQIQALQDSQAAATAAAESERTLAAERERIEQESAGLERQLLQLQGDTVAIRALERAALAASNRALYDQIQALQDSQAAAAAAAESERALAAGRERIAQERAGLERQLLQLQGDTVAIRALERAALDESNRALYDQITALQDSQAAAVEAARAQQQYADAMASAGKTAADEIERLRGVTSGASSNPAQLAAMFSISTAQARSGSADALSKLPQLSAALEAATTLSARNAAEVTRMRAWLASSLTETLQTLGLPVPALATGTNMVPQNMLAMLHKGEAVVPAAYNPANGSAMQDKSLISEVRALRAELADLRAEARSTAVATNKTARILDRVTPDGTSLQTVAAT